MAEEIKGILILYKIWKSITTFENKKWTKKYHDKDILLIFFLLSFSNLNGQNIISGKIISLDSKNPIKDVEIFEKSVGKLAQTNSKGFFEFTTTKNKLSLIFFAYNYNVLTNNYIY